VAPDGNFDTFGSVQLRDQTRSLSPARYVALSHCWGEIVPECVTTKATLEDRKKCIVYDSMPRTFQDAVKFTRSLRVRYLWIDSICIIQNDQSDWRHEASQMEKVYGGSYLTLAAVHAEDCNGGLFVNPDPKYSSYPLSPIKINGNILNPLARHPLPLFHSWESHQLGEPHPLFYRAWAYQERLVAPRVLYFTKNELVWECFESVGCECVGTVCSPYQEGWGHRGARCPKTSHRQLLENGDAAKRWHQIVEEYSKLKLTLASDKLPAISAVARQVQQYKPNDKYVAGLWRNSLFLDLLWVHQPHLEAELRPHNNFAPTWSWASVSGAIEYIYLWPDEETIHPRLRKVFCQYINDEEEYGQVESASLCFFGKIIQCSLGTDSRSLEYSTKWNSESEPDFVKITINMDCILEDEHEAHKRNEQKRKVYLFNIAEIYDKNIWCLILVEAPGEGAYHRIGMLQVDYWSSRLAYGDSWAKIRSRNALETNLQSIFSTIEPSEITIE
jgi:hypothetical protein